eukprot:CAMPEP_0113895828 /NCGR_PEP_ID=MMETSP0780_2-20120614/17612_1 /TAXON_ID=652834 /ORGANISM="Palpitomonas bilix" /LENGTH=687 /DNA_ID=CAMNT_0000886767 /DNA_START=59 /DNA_END=2122 /DNA_ORIENTATION=+ /assembly_acc=CAM_ASM_000599
MALRLATFAAGKAVLSTSRLAAPIFIKGAAATVVSTRSRGSYHYQKSLPRLPIPEHEFAMNKYIDMVAPVVSEEQFASTKKLVEDFKKEEGPQLHDLLKKYDEKNKHSSFISHFWYDVYLKARSPLPVNWNPQITFRYEENAERDEPNGKAARFIHASAEFYTQLKAEVIDPDVYALKDTVKSPLFKSLVQWVPESFSYYVAYLLKGYPLDMSQYPRLFASTRVPSREKDYLATYPDVDMRGDGPAPMRGPVTDPSRLSRHVTVQYKNHLFEVEAIRESGEIVPVADVRAAVEEIRKIGDSSGPAFPMGCLTALDRDEWADIRQRLVESSSTNSSSLRSIDSSLFVLSLDEVTPKDETEEVRLMLHGRPGNRWFDKCFSLVMNQKGRTAINFEHSWGDGVSVLRYANDVFAKVKTIENSPASSTPASFRPLQFELNDELKLAVAKSEESATKLVESMDLQFMEYREYGREYLKKCKLSPDAVLQQVFQLAYYKHKGKTVSTYESASTSGFKHGRTEVIRPATKESAAFVRAVAGGAAPDEQLELLRKATAKHAKLSLEAAIGKGIDRYLFGLRKMAEIAGKEEPAIFSDPAYTLATENILSTSTLHSDVLEAGCFGPVHPDGYGIGYGFAVEKGADGSVVDRSGYFVSSFHNDTKGFLSAIAGALDDLKPLLEVAKKQAEAAKEGGK